MSKEPRGPDEERSAGTGGNSGAPDGEEDGMEGTMRSWILGPQWEDVGSAARARLVTDPSKNAGWLSVVEVLLEEGFALPFHVHYREDEVVSVLGGEIRVHEEGREWGVRAGGVTFLTRGREHSISVVRAPARLSLMFNPAGFEQVVPALCEAGAPDADDGTLERLVPLAARHGCKITGEPPKGDPPEG